MPQGLQVWDENGINVLDTNTDTVKILGKFPYNPNPVTITHPLLGTEKHFSIFYPPFSKVSDSHLKVEYSGSSVTVFNTKESYDRVIYVGVY